MKAFVAVKRYASKLAVADAEIELTREVDGGLETIALALPAVVTVDLRLNTPRCATLPNITKAKKKPLETIAAATLGVDLAPRTQLLKVTEPPARSSRPSCTSRWASPGPSSAWPA
jgi:electron transfer flavoprotein beta subunit